MAAVCPIPHSTIAEQRPQVFALRGEPLLEAGRCSLYRRDWTTPRLTSRFSSFARARENSDAAYRGGVVSLIEVLDADANLLLVRDAKAQARIESARAAIASFRVLGGR
jgi:hypothetical protein